MRKNTREVFNAWKEGKAKFANHKYAKTSIWCTEQGIIWSYGTVLVMRNANTIVLNKTRYSHTTTVHQNSLHVLLEEYCKETYKDEGLSLLIVDDISMYRSMSEMEHYLSPVGV
jgi:hypothetical protein